MPIGQFINLPRITKVVETVARALCSLKDINSDEMTDLLFGLKYASDSSRVPAWRHQVPDAEFIINAYEDALTKAGFAPRSTHPLPPQVRQPDQIVLSVQPVEPLYLYPRGCVCPAGAEQGCRGLGCPRRAMGDMT